jgi:hypothetical protein
MASALANGLEPLRPARLDPAFQAEALEQIADPDRHLRAIGRVGRLAGIEIEQDLRRAAHLLPLGQERMQLEIGQVPDPRQAREIVHDQVVDPRRVAAAGHLRGLDPRRPVFRRALLVEELRVHAVGVALHRQRPVFQVRQQHRRDLREIIDHLALGEAGVGIEDLVEIRQPQLVPADGEGNLLARHGGRGGLTARRFRSGGPWRGPCGL